MSKKNTSKIDYQANIRAARLECKEQALESARKHAGEAQKIISELNRQFLENTKGLCPVCGRPLYLHHRTRKGFAVYICLNKHPNRTFNTNNGTIFRNSNLKMWQIISLRDAIVYETSIRRTAFCSRTSTPTAHKRRIQLLKMFRKPEEKKIWGGEVIVDEAYLESREDNVYTQRKSDGSKIKKVGLSKDKACIYSAVTGHGSHFNLRVEGDGKPDTNRTKSAMSGLIDLEKTKVIKSDGEKTYSKVCSELGIECKSEKKSL